MKRESVDTDKCAKRLYPIRPYHERYRDYIAKRDEIFLVNSIVKANDNKRPKRSTMRLRRHYKILKHVYKYTISGIINNSTDRRYYARVQFLSFDEHGLLDTGANVSCIGSSLAEHDFTQYEQFVFAKSYVRTADGRRQKTLGYLQVEVSFRGITKRLKILIIPSITQRLILGLDFWKAFQLAPEVFQSTIVSDTATCDIPKWSIEDCNLENDLTGDTKSTNIGEQKYPLSFVQISQLQTIIDLFPNFLKQGLGRTTLITHDIDVGDAKPVKQRFYPVSPAVEKLMYTEIDRMISLGVIEPSSAP